MVSFASWSTPSFPSMPQWLGTQQKRTRVPLSLDTHHCLLHTRFNHAGRYMEAWSLCTGRFTKSGMIAYTFSSKLLSLLFFCSLYHQTTLLDISGHNFSPYKVMTLGGQLPLCRLQVGMSLIYIYIYNVYLADVVSILPFSRWPPPVVRFMLDNVNSLLAFAWRVETRNHW